MKIINFEVQYYMFCHPCNVIVRKGRRNLLRWQHLPASPNVHLCVRQSTLGDSTIGLYLGPHLLESLPAPVKVRRVRRLAAQCHGQWFAFSWTTSRGRTRFQISLKSRPQAIELEALLEELQLLGLHDDDSNFSQASGFNLNTQATLVHANETQREEYHDSLNSPDCATLIDGATPSQSRLSLRSETSWPGNPLTAPKLECRSVARTPGTLTDTKTDMDENGGLKAHQDLYLGVETYSFAMVKRHSCSWSHKVLWHHLGLMSGLSLSLLAEGRAKPGPVVVLSRGAVKLEEFTPDPTMLRACFVSGIIVFKKRLGQGIDTVREVQLHMTDADIAAVCDWLGKYRIPVHHPSHLCARTDATTHISSGWGSRAWSEHSIDSSETTPQSSSCQGGTVKGW